MADDEFRGRSMAFWESVGIDYAANELTILQIRAKYDLTQGEFTYARQQLKWTRRKTPQVNRKSIIKRLFRLLDRMLEKLEAEMTKVGEQEVNVLGRLVQAMGKLIEIETATDDAATPRTTKDLHDIRRKLVARIEELKRV
ncbi:MAG TPA: hypothetical protein VN109_12670 [Devosia sp.]|jgi:uncharacterized membrane protein YgaE (UPF0421/DUF939 family)|nr:hypothetical protein [Devosia sp.]